MKLELITDGKRHLSVRPYSIENLHRAARSVGIARCWYHRGRTPHYDIPLYRMSDIGAIATVVTSRELVKEAKMTLHRAMTKATKLLVFQALDNAVNENGYTDLLTQTDAVVARDLVSCDADLEREDPDDLMKYVAEWRKNRCHS